MLEEVSFWWLVMLLCCQGSKTTFLQSVDLTMGKLLLETVTCFCFFFLITHAVFQSMKNNFRTFEILPAPYY